MLQASSHQSSDSGSPTSLSKFGDRVAVIRTEAAANVTLSEVRTNLEEIDGHIYEVLTV